MILSLVLSTRTRARCLAGPFCRESRTPMLPSRLTSHVRRLPSPRYSPCRRRRAEFARWSRKGLPVPVKVQTEGREENARRALVSTKGSKGAEKRRRRSDAHEIRLPQPFSHTVQLIRGRTRHDEILGRGDTADAKQVGRGSVSSTSPMVQREESSES
jgi:hypothetical protein